jgi:PEP-CTERM motif-containing protein
MIHFRIPLCVCMLLIATVATQSGVQRASADTDMLVTNVGGRVTIGGADELETVNEHFELTSQVFRREMVPGFPPFDPHDYGHDDPGFFGLSSTRAADFPAGASALPPNADVTVHFPSFSVGGYTDNLFFWDGSGAVSFQPISTTQPGYSIGLDPNPVGITSATGALHEHPTFTLDNGAPGIPADGIYLNAPTISVTGLSDSKHFFMVWIVDHLIPDQSTADALETALDNDNPPIVNGKNFAYVNQAVSYVRNNLAVPEPSSLALAGMACIGLVGFASRTQTNRWS